MKNRKAPGTDGIKPEFIKVFTKSEVLMRALMELESRTVMVPKVKKPKVTELRPIALTNIGLKVTMAVVRNSLEEHIRKNELEKEVQAGFTG